MCVFVCLCVCKKETSLTQQPLLPLPLLLLQRVVSQSGALTLSLSPIHMQTPPRCSWEHNSFAHMQSLRCRCPCRCRRRCTHTLALRSLLKSKFQVRLLQFIREFCCVLHSFFSWLITALQNNSMPYRAIPSHSSLSLSDHPLISRLISASMYPVARLTAQTARRNLPKFWLKTKPDFFLPVFFISPHFAVFSVLFCVFFRSLSCAWAEAFCFLFTFDWVFGMQFYCSLSISPYFGLFYFILFLFSAICF